MKNVILLGGSGYIGTHLAEVWLKKDPEVQIFSISRKGKPADLLASLENNNRIEWIAADIFDVKSYLSKLPSEAYAIVDLVGTATAKSDELFEQLNVEPVKIMINLMNKLSIPNGCYISGVMGMPGKNKQFISSKRKGENLAKGSKKNIGIVRPSLVYGDRPGVGLMVLFMKFMGSLPGKSDHKPILVQDLANEIIQVCEGK